MAMVKVLTGEVKAPNLVKAQIAELDQQKKNNPIVNYHMLQKDGEYIIDFLPNDNSPDGQR